MALCLAGICTNEAIPGEDLCEVHYRLDEEDAYDPWYLFEGDYE